MELSNDFITPTSSPINDRKFRQNYTIEWAENQLSLSQTSSKESCNQQSEPFPSDDAYLDDEVCSLVDSNAWHDNDLILAAELGKALLERNKYLESHSRQQQEVIDEQHHEINLLVKQVETLKDLNYEKGKLCEDIDRHYIELEDDKKQLQQLLQQEKQRSSQLEQEVLHLEKDVVKERSVKLEDRSNFEIQNFHSSPKKVLRKTSSFPIIPDLFNVNAEVEHVNMRREYLAVLDKLNDYKFQTTSLNWKLYETQQNVQQLEEERRSAQVMLKNSNNQVVILKKKLKEAEQTLDILQQEKLQTERNKESVSIKKCTDMNVIDMLSSIEIDENYLESGLTCGKLSTGGVVYSSRDHLNKIGAQSLSNDVETLHEVSLLHELNDKYETLVKEYEHLVQNKTQKSKDKVERDTAAKISNIFSEEKRTERKKLTAQNYKPKYKDLFRTALETIHSVKHS